VETANNRLRRVKIGDSSYDYAFDDSGNMRSETTSRHFEWNHSDQMKAFRTQTEGAEPSVHAHYFYDAAGQRVKKLVRKHGGQVEVTHYIDGLFEHHRWGGRSQAGENNHVHVMDDKQRIALVRTGGPHPDDQGPAVQFQLGDHLGSSNVVVDSAGALVNREEFTPYGETSFGSFAKKRYRFTGKERDEESGMDYHSARYYALWLGRWATADPAGFVDGANLYRYVRSNPIGFVDPDGHESKQQQWEKEFQSEHPELKGIGTVQGTRDEGQMTDTGVRVPLHAGDYLLPRPHYERKAAAFLAWQGFIHYAELVEAGHDAAAIQLAMTLNRPTPRDNEFDLSRYARWSERAKIASEGVQLAVGMLEIAANFRAAARPKPPRPPSAPCPAPVPPQPPASQLPRMQIRYTGAMATSPADAQFLRFNVEWAQNERGFLTLGTRNPADASLRGWARRWMDRSGFSRQGRQAMHPLDSALNPWVQTGTPGRTYYFGNTTVNLSFGGQIGAEIQRLNLRLGDNFNVDFVGFPTYDNVRPVAPPSSPPNR
jgi:RHS repeat-associated protein